MNFLLFCCFLANIFCTLFQYDCHFIHTFYSLFYMYFLWLFFLFVVVVTFKHSFSVVIFNPTRLHNTTTGNTELLLKFGQIMHTSYDLRERKVLFFSLHSWVVGIFHLYRLHMNIKNILVVWVSVVSCYRESVWIKQKTLETNLLKK